jgi:hypothetical protein
MAAFLHPFWPAGPPSLLLGARQRHFVLPGLRAMNADVEGVAIRR